MTIDDAMSICLKHKLKVYPTHNKGKMFVTVDNGSSFPKIGKVEHTQKTINEAITNTWIHYANRIKNKKL